MTRWGFTLMLLLAAAVPGAQDVDAGSTPTSPAEEAVSFNSERASARATMRTFLESFYAEGGADLTAASRCLDLSDVPSEIRTWKGRELAVRIKDVLDRTRYVRYGNIPDDPDGSPHVVLHRPEGEIVLARSSSGEWLFTPSTVASIEALSRATEKREVLEQVEQQTPPMVTPSDG